jgi:hypothetical protein
MLDLEKSEFLSDAQIKEQAPCVFSEKASAEVSKHYTHIPTSKVINDMRTLGWDVVDAKEVKARKNSTNAFTFTAGLFRMICENGLVISTTQFEDVKMRHMGYSFEELQVKIKEMVEKLPLTVESMNKMQATELGQNEAVAFAKKAITTRFKEDELKRIKIDFKDLLTPTRDEDKGKDLWSVFNVVQEKIIDGDFEYKVAGKLRKARQIKNFKQDQKINKELFDVALEFAS